MGQALLDSLRIFAPKAQTPEGQTPEGASATPEPAANASN